ncbi:MAG: hypothetical protein ACO1SX_13890 [Actinomycetota bacterium]
MKFPKMGRRPATYADVIRAWQERAPMLRRENMGKNWAADLSADVGAKFKVTTANLGRRVAEGAMLGSRFGLPGAALGAAGGLGVGAVENLVNLNNGTVSKQVYGDSSTPTSGGAKPQDPQLAELQKQTQLLMEMKGRLGGGGGGAVDYSAVPRALQYQALASNARGLA